MIIAGADHHRLLQRPGGGTCEEDVDPGAVGHRTWDFWIPVVGADWNMGIQNMGIFFGILTMRIVISFGVKKNMAGKSPINGGFVRWEHHRTSHAGFPTSHGTDYPTYID